MITLKELTNRQLLTGETDSQLISTWFVENDMALEGIEIVSKISKKKIKDDEHKYKCLVDDLHMYGVTENVIKTFGIKDGCKLNNIIKDWIIYNRLGEDFIKIYPEYMDWLANFIPTKELPFIFWQPFIKWLNENDIYFKDQKRGEV